MGKDELRKEILEKVKEYYSSYMKPAAPFKEGATKIPYAGRVFDHEEMENAVDACLDFWLTSGRYCSQFEEEFAAFFGTRFCLLANSGSSANLLALSCLTSKTMGERRLLPGDKVITPAVGFPTTVNPIFQNGLVPRFVDVELGTYNPSPEAIKDAIDEKTKAIMLAHTLGNPFDCERISEIAQENGLFLIEDCCDALGSRFAGRNVGTFGDIATVSFYPAHHMTMGEGGAILTSNPILKKIIESFRDWGRDCWCAPGKDNTCRRRFGWKLGELPYGYDHKYIYSNIGYNLKALDFQGAIGVAQLKKLPGFIRKRKENYDFLVSKLSKYPDSFILPRILPKADISPFGLPLTVKEEAGFTKNQIVEHLESKGIATRMMFGGNITRQPAYVGEKFEVAGDLHNADNVMNNTFWIGVYPGISKEMLQFMALEFERFLSK